MEYKVTGNIQHDNKSYGPGDTLDLSEERAAQLIEAGALEDPNKPEAEEVPPTPKVAKKAKASDEKVPSVGGEKKETGEPSIDGRTDGEQSEAKDVTPGVQTEPAPAPKDQTTPHRGWFGRKETSPQQAASPAKPEAPKDDPSATL